MQHLRDQWRQARLVREAKITYVRCFDGYNATFVGLDGVERHFMVRKSYDPYHGIRGPWWTLVESDVRFQVQQHAQAHPDYFASFADLKVRLAEYEDEANGVEPPDDGLERRRKGALDERTSIDTTTDADGETIYRGDLVEPLRFGTGPKAVSGIHESGGIEYVLMGDGRSIKASDVRYVPDLSKAAVADHDLIARLTYTEKRDSADQMRHMDAILDGEVLGWIDVFGRYYNAKARGKIKMIQVWDPHKRKGVATALFEEAQRRWSDLTIKHSSDRTNDGDAWAREIGGTLPRRQSASSDEMPSGPPESVPVPSGHYRLFHRSPLRNADSIRQHGLGAEMSRQIDFSGEMVWGSSGFQTAVDINMAPQSDWCWVEYHVEWDPNGRPPAEGNSYTSGSIPPSQIINVWEPWHFGVWVIVREIDGGYSLSDLDFLRRDGEGYAKALDWLQHHQAPAWCKAKDPHTAKQASGPSWRGLVPDGEPFWMQHDACIISNVAGRARSYEVYIRGQQIANRHSLQAAKDEIEGLYGVLSWQQVRPEPLEVTHAYFGPTTEFSEPQTYYVADLP